jgi:hypothetical protein
MSSKKPKRVANKKLEEVVVDENGRILLDNREVKGYAVGLPIQFCIYSGLVGLVDNPVKSREEQLGHAVRTHAPKNANAFAISNEVKDNKWEKIYQAAQCYHIKI